MLYRVLRRVKRAFASAEGANPSPKQIKIPISVTQREMVRALSAIPYWEDKMNFAKNFDYSDEQGVWVQPSAKASHQTPDIFTDPLCHKVNYGCGHNIITGWLNVDLYGSEAGGYRRVNLLERHPFENNSVFFGFSEDMLEHLNQAESIFFLSEIYRTLVPNGVIRLSFPGLEGVLQKHYTPSTEKRVKEGELEAYSFWDHVHFYSREELWTVAKHLGFREIKFFEYGKSDSPELSKLETREHQIGLNTNAELIK